jgi:very-short-patch-repair endonuclease
LKQKEKTKDELNELEQLGITVIKFTNDEVINNIKKVLETINEIASHL